MPLGGDGGGVWVVEEWSPQATTRVSKPAATQARAARATTTADVEDICPFEIPRRRLVDQGRALERVRRGISGRRVDIRGTARAARSGGPWSMSYY